MIRAEAASLTLVKLRGEPPAATRPEKAGDLTAQLSAPAAAAPAIEFERPIAAEEMPPVTPLRAEPPATPLAVIAAATDRPRDETPPLRDRASYWDFVDYWDRLRGGQGLPLLTMLDRELVAGSWPDSMIVSYAGGAAAMPQIARLSQPTGAIEYTPMVTDWIISCARQVARQGEAMEDEQEFPLARGSAGYRLLLLPFATPEGKSDHVLCHLSPAQNGQAIGR